MLSYLIRQSRAKILVAALAGITSGVCSVLLLTQINEALVASSAQERMAVAWRFAALAVAATLSQVISSVLFERLNQRVHAEMRRFISDRVIKADYQKLEAIGGPSIQSALSEHSTQVAAFFVSFPTMLLNGIVATGCLIYMAWLSWQVFIVAAGAIGLGSLAYHLAHLRAIRHLNMASQEQDRLFGHFRSLVEGAKELRLHAKKRHRFAADVLGDSMETVRRERTLGMSLFLVASAWGRFLIFAFIGLVLFALVGEVAGRQQVVTGFALVFVYMISPLENLLIAVPRMNLARVAGRRIDELVKKLAHNEHDEHDGAASARTPFQSVVLQGVCHRYYHEGVNELFNLGPVDLAFSPGEIVFLVGGNGSGKTTLAKLLVGLYKPERGSILLNGRAVDDTNRDSYRQTFSAIFSDFHLFERMLDAQSVEHDARGNALLTKLRLQHKAQVRNGAFTTQSLSQGQRKRLALVINYLEDRPFLVFDEWAADQDPLFKDVFYRELLPELKHRGKAVLVISHDDRYFHLADRLVRMESGQVTSIERVMDLPPVKSRMKAAATGE